MFSFFVCGFVVLSVLKQPRGRHWELKQGINRTRADSGDKAKLHGYMGFNSKNFVLKIKKTFFSQMM
jgi:hypothetical protein